MSIRAFSTLLAAFVLTAVAGADTPRPEGLVIARLGGETFAEREAAARDLEALGAPALEALRKAFQSADPEVRRRARDVVRRIERRQEAEKLLEPTRVRLAYRDARLDRILADLSRGSGVPIRSVIRVTAPPVTLETEEVTFWEALDRLCAAAVLTEVPPNPAPARYDQNVAFSAMTVMGRGQTRGASDIMRPARDDRPAELVLSPDRRAARPTCYVGAVRVRAMPPETTLPGQPREAGEAVVVLDVLSEGKMQWHRGVGFRLDRASDGEGRPLALRPASFRPPVGSRSGVIVNGVPLDPEPDEPGPAGRLVPVRLRYEGKAPPRLKELAGVVIGQVRMPAEPIVTVDRILGATGKTVTGERGGAVRVVEVEKGDGGWVRVRATVEPVPRGPGEPRALPFTGRVFINGRQVNGVEDLLCSLNFALLDDRGRPFLITRAISTGRRDATAEEYELLYEPQKGQGEPTKFVYVDRRTLFVEVPFVLKDLPLQ